MTFLDVQTDGVTLPVPGSNSSFSLDSVVVVGPRENQCRDVKLESAGGAEHNMSEPFVNSPETKRLMEIAIASGASVRTAYKTVRNRLRIEARGQKELDGGVEPKVVLDSFSQSGGGGAAPAVWAVEESVDSRRQSCPKSSCEGQEVARDSVLVDHQRQGVSRRRSVQLQACGDTGERANGEWEWDVMDRSGT